MTVTFSTLGGTTLATYQATGIADCMAKQTLSLGKVKGTFFIPNSA
jgi:hypothetical protein